MATNYNSALDMIHICDLPMYLYVINSTVLTISQCVHILKHHIEHREYIQSLCLNKAEGKGESDRNLLARCEREFVPGKPERCVIL
jgi:hypothetical protein